MEGPKRVICLVVAFLTCSGGVALIIANSVSPQSAINADQVCCQSTRQRNLPGRVRHKQSWGFKYT